MNKYRILVFIALSMISTFSIAKEDTKNRQQYKAPFGFKWGMSIDFVRKMEWVKNKNNNEFVCVNKTGSLITKCTNSYAPSQLMIDGDYALFFDRNNSLFKISFLSSGVFDTRNKKDQIYSTYHKYKDILEKKYGKPDIEDFSDGYYYQWGDLNPRITMSTRNDKGMVYLEISYFSKESSRIIKEDLDYRSIYEYGIM